MIKTTNKRRRPISSAVKSILVLISLLSAVVQIIPLFVMNSPPVESSVWAISGLFFPWLFILNLILLFLWLAFRKLYFLIPLGALIATFSITGGYFQLNQVKNTESANMIKALTYNVKYLGMDYFKQHETNRDSIIGVLETEKADIICLQEFDCAPGTFTETIDLIKEKTGAKHYVYTRYYPGIKNTEMLLLLTTKEVLNKGSLSDRNSRRYAVYADIVCKNDTLRVINCHLQSIYLSEEDNLGLEDFTAENAGTGIIQKKSKRIYSKLSRAYAKRAIQSDSLVKFITRSPYKTILCGDFNDTPSSYTYASMKNIMNDAFREAGRGSGITYGSGFPSFRIDYIFHHPEIKASSYIIHRDITLSDHYPVTGVLQFKDP